ncbi:MAG: undecaprenyl-phosphate glucose phosphotransferase [Eubacterium sp.]|nr:undecaprenyl-phosphate glucose phosphotransferase [Eubacterium sp.]
MNKNNQNARIRMQLLIDAVLIIASYLLAWNLRFRFAIFHSIVRVLPLRYYIIALMMIVPTYLFIYYACNLYDVSRIQRRRHELTNLLKANIIGILLIILVLYLTKQQHFARNMLFLFFVLNCLMDAVARNFVHIYMRRKLRSTHTLKKILLIGYSHAAEQYIDRVIANTEWGYKVRGILDDTRQKGETYRGVRILGTTKDLEAFLNTDKVDEIAITLNLREYDKLEALVAECEKSGIHTQFVPDYYKIIPTKPYTEDVLGLPIVNIRYVPLSNSFNAFTKRVVDVFGACVALVLFSPVMLAAVIGIKVSSPGPLIFRQKRVGLHNKEFEMLKFRSMRYCEGNEEKAAWTVENDPRVTKFGNLLRRTSMDELPQLINVLRGEMSLVGPRPEQPFFVEKFREEIPRYMIKHQVRPGMTGWAQIHGYRGDTSIMKRIEYDLYYIENWSISMDFKILFLTFFRGFVNKNAY